MGGNIVENMRGNMGGNMEGNMGGHGSRRKNAYSFNTNMKKSRTKSLKSRKIMNFRTKSNEN